MSEITVAPCASFANLPVSKVYDFHQKVKTRENGVNSITFLSDNPGIIEK